MKDKFKKNSAKKRSFVKAISVIFLVLILIVGIFLLTVSLKNIIEISNIDEDAKNVSEEVAKNSKPILINNLLVGACYNNTWVSSEKFYFYGEAKKNTKVDVYTSSGKKGTYELQGMTKDATKNSVYITTTNSNKYDEYIAVESSNNNIMNIPAIKYNNIAEEDYKYVKKALGIYRIFNPSINIVDSYDVTINNQNKGRIYVVNNKPQKYMGGYSAVIYKSVEEKTEVLKYSYVCNLNNSSDWPIYSFKFIADLNQDGNNEIIIQETKEFYTKYDVLEFREDKFVEVLSSKFEI